MFKLNRLLWWLLGVLILGGAGTSWVMSRPKDEYNGQYITALAENGDIEESVAAVGVVQPLQYVDVGTQVTGQLKTLHVQVGDFVRKGALVAEIDPALFHSRVEAIQWTLQALRARLQEREAQSQLAILQYARNRQLFAENAISEEALQQSAAQAQVSAAQVAELKAQIRQTQSQLAGEETNLRYTKIHAPMAGTVVSLTAKQGQTLVASQQAPTILRIANLATMTVSAQVSEADVPKIKLGMPVYFNTLGERERRWTSSVRQILPTPETVNSVVLYNVLFDVDNADQALKTQMSAQVYFILAQASNALLVPSASLEALALEGKRQSKERERSETQDPSPKTHTVRVLKGAKVEMRQVTVGILNRVSAQVLSGLAEGETVILGQGGASKYKKVKKDKKDKSRLPTLESS